MLIGGPLPKSYASILESLIFKTKLTDFEITLNVRSLFIPSFIEAINHITVYCKQKKPT